MMSVFLFKMAQLGVLAVLTVFISDFRQKKGMVPLVGEKWTSLLKITYLIPLAAYVDILLSMRSVAPLDYAALAMTLLGTFLVVRSRRDLAAGHTWSGYRMEAEAFTARGIYAWIRHPLYAGIFVVVSGSLCSILPRIDLSLSLALPVAALVCISYVLCFLVFTARRETVLLLERFGAPFRRYRESVHPFLPLKRYVPAANDRGEMRPPSNRLRTSRAVDNTPHFPQRDDVSRC